MIWSSDIQNARKKSRTKGTLHQVNSMDHSKQVFCFDVDVNIFELLGNNISADIGWEFPCRLRMARLIMRRYILETDSKRVSADVFSYSQRS